MLKAPEVPPATDVAPRTAVSTSDVADEASFEEVAVAPMPAAPDTMAKMPPVPVVETSAPKMSSGALLTEEIKPPEPEGGAKEDFKMAVEKVDADCTRASQPPRAPHPWPCPQAGNLMQTQVYGQDSLMPGIVKEARAVKIKTPAYKTRSTRKLVLDNGMKVLIFSDKDLPQAPLPPPMHPHGDLPLTSRAPPSLLRASPTAMGAGRTPTMPSASHISMSTWSSWAPSATPRAAPSIAS